MAEDRLREAVIEAVEDVDLVRQSKAPVEIAIEDGVVTVEANVMSTQMRRLLLVSVASVPGVVKVIDKVRVDRKIEIDVASALAAHETFDALRPPLIVNCYKGRVTLSGYVPDEALIHEGMSIAASIRGVRDVFSELEVGDSPV